MRHVLSLMVMGCVLGAPAAFAQQQQQQQQAPSYVYKGTTSAAPVYNTPNNYNANSGSNSFYNSGANLQLLPMQQMVAGRNAPSYSYGSANERQQNTLYNSGSSFGNRGSLGGLTPDQLRQIRADRDAQALAYERQYTEEMNNRQRVNYDQPAQTGSQYQGSAFNSLYADNAQPKPQVRRKVIYNQLNNPLVDPPRLFNPDR